MTTHDHKLPFPSERAIEDYVFDHICEHQQCPITEQEFQLVFRQVNLGPYGIADIVKVDYSPDAIYVTVLELKNELLNPSHVAQLARYIAGLNHILGPYGGLLQTKTGVSLSIFGELAGPFDKNANDLPFLSDILEDRISIYDLSLTYDEGFKSDFIESGWTKTLPKQKPLKKQIREVFNHFKPWQLEYEEYLASRKKLEVVK